MSRFDEYRYLIDEVDEEIVELLKHRYELTLLLHHYKIEHNIEPQVDLIRQEQVAMKYTDAFGEDIGRQIARAITGDEEP